MHICSYWKFTCSHIHTRHHLPCMQSPSVQFLDCSTSPSQSFPPFFGAGAVHSLRRQWVHSVPQVDHLLQDVHLPSTETRKGCNLLVKVMHISVQGSLQLLATPGKAEGSSACSAPSPFSLPQPHICSLLPFYKCAQSVQENEQQVGNLCFGWFFFLLAQVKHGQKFFFSRKIFNVKYFL